MCTSWVVAFVHADLARDAVLEGRFRFRQAGSNTDRVLVLMVVVVRWGFERN